MLDVLIEKVMIECPMCDEIHLVEKRKRVTRAKIKGDLVEYFEYYYRCANSDEVFDFVPGKLMDENLLAARNAYRTIHNMMTSHDIVLLRKKYGLTQKEFSSMLGWGEVTIARYETKLIQDETHDDILKVVREDALEARKYLERNKASFSPERYQEICEVINAEVERTSLEYFTRRKIEAQYIPYYNNLEATGGVQLDIEKTRNMMLFFASKCKTLFKVKLMRLLWYSDALHFQRHNISMSGLVYQHMPMGALPIANFDLMNLVEVETLIDDYNEAVSYRILPNADFSEDVFTEEELQTLYAVVNKFKDYNGKKIAQYMHKEVAYTKTKECDLIPFSLAKLIRPIETV